MSLESLFGKGEYFPQNIESFGGVPEYISRYRSLKSSPFYDTKGGWMFDDNKESGAWIANVWAPDKPRDWHLWTSSQLLAVIVEALDDPSTARIRYEELRQSDFFTKETVLWNSGYNDESGWMRYDFTPENQLVGVLAEACFDVESAKRRYRLLKQTPLCDEKSEEWVNVSNYTSRSNKRPSVVLPLIIEGLLFDKDSAKKRYEELKANQIKNGQSWLDISKEDRVHTLPLFFGLLLEAVFDRDSAKKYLDALKETLLYSPKTQLWFRWWQKEGKGEIEIVPDVCDSDTQLMGILLDSLLSSE